jgi:Rrf2 family protein
VLLSQTGTYAVRAAIHLAEGEALERPIPVVEIANALDVPRNYLSKILHQLAREGVLISARGPGGGFRLAAEPEKIPLDEILGAVEPQRFDRRCLLGRAECNDADPCPAHGRWQKLADGIGTFLQQTTLADLRRAERHPKRTRRRRVAVARSA